MRGQQGSVLVFTLWLMAGLAAAALLFGHRTMLNYRCQGNRVAALQAEHACAAGLEYALQVIAATPAGELPDVADFTAEDLRIGECRVWFLARPGDTAASQPAFGLLAESGKLNVNTATLEMLQELQGMPDNLAGAIVDWRDADSDISPEGAETETYLALDPPYVAKNGPLETVGELGLLNGVQPILLMGRDANRNGYLEDWEIALAEPTAERFSELPDLGMLDVLTVSSHEPNTTTGGDPRTNLNASGSEAINALADVLGTDRANSLASATGLGSRQFGSALEFCIQGALNEDETQQILDRFTTVDETTIPGRVNVNTAPKAVLACLPGVGEEVAEQAITYREANPDGLDTPLWLVYALGEDAALAAAAHVTTKTYQIVADIVAVTPNGGIFRRTSSLIDTTSGEPLVVAQRDLTRCGWPLGAALREELVGKPWEPQE